MSDLLVLGFDGRFKADTVSLLIGQPVPASHNRPSMPESTPSDSVNDWDEWP